MYQSLTEIKRMRKKYHLTQKDLARLSGVSQSLIAKVEAGTLDPTFTKAQAIFTALKQVEEQEELKAKDIMNKKVIFVKNNDYIKNVIKIMKQKGISQIPVMKNKSICGIITESIILKHIVDHPDKLGQCKVEEVMDDAPPVISPQTTRKTLLNLLQEYSVVLVAQKGDVKGIISKSDLLGRI